VNIDDMGRLRRIGNQSDEDLQHEQNKAYTRLVIKEVHGWGMFLSFKISFWGFLIVLSRDPHNFDKLVDSLNFAWQIPVALFMIALHTLFPGLVKNEPPQDGPPSDRGPRQNQRGQEALAQARNVAADLVPPPSREA
jgi:hypothetical protein